ncbi:amidohydrolase family protein [Gordonia sp. (in: high G+C Gram-positive bacteria)]|uniref:amidohydrolase family protein n=1 Tax=Gordonia sp. (in: high G+C Gram-positive bacteria) TaxID=84139 RepID=UPI001DEA1C29|nr:amidohydrolase family protein [Gordonia sp. (in: high G+C Gram-positive bacteria)]MCB1294539.1 amidohydrolase family protein [Gordonia sp. (in: high G+C Gram-positive bacteria)]HMS75446.1 amidohydrolase family protein [Gordonia sp. (in: high G+C Gram-positive bacteria)]
MTSVLIEGATVVVDATTVSNAPLYVADGCIGAESPGRPDEVVDASDCVVTAGLINAHHHLLQSAFRTLPGTRFAVMSDWLRQMSAAYGCLRVDPELAAAAARVGLAESLLCGVTTVADHHLTWPAGIDPVELAGATIDSAASSGARLVFVRGTARDDPVTAAQSIAGIHDTYLAGAVDGVSDDGRLQLAVGPSGVHADGPETFTALREVATALGLRRRTQANEQVDVAIAAERYGRRPLELLDDWGWLEPDVTIAHLCEVTAGEIELLAARRVTATHAPGCDIPMGWGIAPVAALLRSGVPVGMGTSGGGSNDAGHLLADARLAMQVSGLTGDPVTGRTLLTMCTEGSAQGLGRSDIGHLRPGAAADLCIWDCGDVFDAGVADPVEGLLWAAPGRRPRDVMVAGRWVVRDGRLLTDDSRAAARSLTELIAARSD